MKPPEKIKKGLECCMDCQSCTEYGEPECPYNDVTKCVEALLADSIALIQQLESSRWELFDDLSTAYYGKQMYGLNDDGTVYSRYSCDTMSFEHAVDEFRRLIADE